MSEENQSFYIACSQPRRVSRALPALGATLLLGSMCIFEDQYVKNVRHLVKCDEGRNAGAVVNAAHQV